MKKPFAPLLAFTLAAVSVAADPYPGVALEVNTTGNANITLAKNFGGAARVFHADGAYENFLGGPSNTGRGNALIAAYRVLQPGDTLELLGTNYYIGDSSLISPGHLTFIGNNATIQGTGKIVVFSTGDSYNNASFVGTNAGSIPIESIGYDAAYERSSTESNISFCGCTLWGDWDVGFITGCSNMLFSDCTILGGGDGLRVYNTYATMKDCQWTMNTAWNAHGLQVISFVYNPNQDGSGGLIKFFNDDFSCISSDNGNYQAFQSICSSYYWQSCHFYVSSAYGSDFIQCYEPQTNTIVGCRFDYYGTGTLLNQQTDNGNNNFFVDSATTFSKLSTAGGPFDFTGYTFFADTNSSYAHLTNELPAGTDLFWNSNGVALYHIHMAGGSTTVNKLP